MKMTKTIGFIGAGNMSGSIIAGLINAGFSPNTLWVSDPKIQSLNNLKKKFKIQTTTENDLVVEKTDIIILAVKPQQLSAVIKELGAVIQQPKKLIISIAAMVNVKTLKKWLGNNALIIRCMPNLPVQVGAGACALYTDSALTKIQKKLVENIFNKIGLTVWVENEKHLDIVTVLAGSGPAYFYLVIEVLQKAAIKLGLPPVIADKLALQTGLGSMQLAVNQQQGVKDLREKVTSPGGTTEQAIKKLQTGKIEKLFYEALKAAKVHAEKTNRLLNQKQRVKDK